MQVNPKERNMIMAKKSKANHGDGTIFYSNSKGNGWVR